MNLEVLKESLTICRLDYDQPIPSWAFNADGFLSITRTNDELSIVAESSVCSDTTIKEGNWRALKISGSLDFSMTGILASLACPLAEASISIFTISTFNTDYLLVKSHNLTKTIQILTALGHTIKS